MVHPLHAYYMYNMRVFVQKIDFWPKVHHRRASPPSQDGSATTSCRKRSVSKCKVLVGFGRFPLLVSVFYDRETD